MSVRFNTVGSKVLTLRRRLPPILFNTCSEVPICQFYHADYYNSCTMKSCCFAGENDEFVLSGSDDFNLYMWKVNDADCKIFLFDLFYYFLLNSSLLQVIKRINGLMHIKWFYMDIDRLSIKFDIIHRNV